MKCNLVGGSKEGDDLIVGLKGFGEVDRFEEGDETRKLRVLVENVQDVTGRWHQHLHQSNVQFNSIFKTRQSKTRRRSESVYIRQVNFFTAFI